MFLRGNGILVRPEGMSLFRDLAEKLGVAVEGSTAKHRKDGGFSTFRSMLEHLHRVWRTDRVPGRRLILVLDALNEAPYAEAVVKEAMEMIRDAACFPWIKVVMSLRQEWLSVLAGKLEPQETDPFEAIRPYLYVIPRDSGNRPVWRGPAAPAGGEPRAF